MSNVREVIILNKMDRVDYTEKEIYEERIEGDKEVSQVDI